jgi:hypothetical protein
MKSLFVLIVATGFLLTAPSTLHAAADSIMGGAESSPPPAASPASVGTPDDKPSQIPAGAGMGCEYGCDLYLEDQTICINKQQYKCVIRNWNITGKEC